MGSRVQNNTNSGRAMAMLRERLCTDDVRRPQAFHRFLEDVGENPRRCLRNVFQIFHDMVHYYVPPGVNENPNDPETIHYSQYDMAPLLVDGADAPFFADRLFANRFIGHVRQLIASVQQNHLYVFQGPPGTGKSTFLTNLLQKLADYTHTDQGALYETVWQLDANRLGGFPNVMLPDNKGGEISASTVARLYPDRQVTVPCPNHCHPILQVPREHRVDFLAEVIDSRTLETLQHEASFAWVFSDHPCTICRCIYDALVDRLDSPEAAFSMLTARRHLYNRRTGDGVSVFNPGDDLQNEAQTNAMLQSLLNNLLRDSNAVPYIYSSLAKTNNGVYAIMDVKRNNRDRILNLHGIISDEVHKVDTIEERICSLFLALLNPEDREVLGDVESFEDRLVRISIPYVLDYQTEVQIYRHRIGRHIDAAFLPGVLDAFAKVILASRIQPGSVALKEWIRDPKRYAPVCDQNLTLIKLEIYSGVIPAWLSEEDQTAFDAKRRRAVIQEGATDGQSGISGRQSVQLILEFISAFSRPDRLITFPMVQRFFSTREAVSEKIPEGFLEALAHLYDYTVLQQVQEALYEYNTDQIERDIKNYLSAINYDYDTTHSCRFTGDEITTTREFLHTIETRLLGHSVKRAERRKFRDQTLREYVSKTLARDIIIDGRNITETELFRSLYSRYADRLKENALDPFIDNETFRLAIKAYDTREFESCDRRIGQDVELLLTQLVERFGYSIPGAKWVALHTLDNRVVEKFSDI